MSAAHLEHDIFLLMLNVAQLKESERICAMFLEALNSFWDGITLRLLKVGDPAVGERIAINTVRHHFGELVLDGDLTRLTPDIAALIRNAVGMLAIILENRLQARLLAEENTHLEALIQERTADLRNANQALALEIEEHKHSEEALRKSQAVYHDLVETSQDLIWQCDAEGRYIFLNQAWEGVFGYHVDEMLGRKFSDFQTPEIAARDQEEFARLLAGGSVKGYETTHLHKHGQPIHLVFNAKFVLGSDGQIVGTRGTAYDITDRKHAEEALRESEARFRDLFENMNDAFALHKIILDEYGQPVDYEFLDANPVLLKRIGMPAADLLHKRALELFPHTERAWIDMFGKVALTGEPVQFTNYSVELDKYFETRIYCPRPGYFAALFTDVTARKRAEEEVRALNAELEQRVRERTQELEAANNELQQFAYIVSHDLKAPLRGMSQLTHWLVNDYAGAFDEQGREIADLLLGRVKRMDNLIDGILEYSRIGRVTGQVEQLDLNSLMTEVLDLLSPPSNIQIDIASKLPSISGDKFRIQQVFANLIGNAIKFMDKPQGKIRVTYEDGGETWRFCVMDNGPGIDAKYHDKIFQIFQTLHPRDEVESTGIGLAIVKKIVELYDGKIWVESEVGTGSTFYFTWPKSLTSQTSQV